MLPLIKKKRKEKSLCDIDLLNFLVLYDDLI